MTTVYHVLTTMLGYLLGSLPVGYLVGKLYGVDVRQHGSGRTGGTNVWRATGQLGPPLPPQFLLQVVHHSCFLIPSVTSAS